DLAHERSGVGHAPRPFHGRTGARRAERRSRHASGYGEGTMKKILGILALLVVVFVLTALLNPQFVSAYNQENLVRWTSLFGILSIGVAFVIITGGIDLSVGSV